MKTTDLLTFFQPAESTGGSWTFPLRGSDGLVAQFWVFTRGDEDLSRFSKSTVSEKEQFADFYNDLRKKVQQRGGIVIYASDYNGLARVQIHQAEAPGYISPSKMLRLRPCGDAQLESITSKADMELGDHLLLPVSQDAEARLEALLDDLKGLPSDLESSILNIIRRPSLEWRLDRIELALSPAGAAQTEPQRRWARKEPWGKRLRGLLLRPIPVGPAIAFALLLMAGILFADRWLFKPRKAAGDEAPAGRQTTVVTPPPMPTPRRAGKSTETKSQTRDLNLSLAALFKALESSHEEPLKALYDSHFKNRQTNALKDPNVAWGLTKLQALQLGFIGPSDHMLRDRSAQTAAKKIIRDRFSYLAGDASASILLASTWCQEQGRSEIPSTGQDPRPLALPIACKRLTPDDTVQSLNALTAWVNDEKE